MKKLLLTLMSVAVVAGVSAQPFHLISKDDVKFKSPVLSGNVTEVEMGKKAISTRVAQQELEGNWVFTMGDDYSEESLGDLDLLYTAELQTVGDVTLVVFQSADMEPEFNQPPFAGIFDEQTNVLTFPQINFGTFEDGITMYQFPGIYNWQTDDVDWQEIEAQYDPETGILTFPEDALIGWPAFDTSNQHIGWFGIYSMIQGAQEGKNAIEGIMDDFNGQPVYYNIFGVKVENPQKGQIVIEKRGKTSHKVVF